MSRLRSQNQIHWATLPLLALLPLLATIGCSGKSNPVTQRGTEKPSADEQPAQNGSLQTPSVKVVTTFLPMYWFTKAVAGEKANVEILVPPGSEVHEYQATPANVQAIAQADVLVKNGLSLEEFLEDTVKNAQNAKLKEIEASKGIEPLKDSPVVKPGQSSSQEDHAHEGEKAGELDHDHDHADGNPHIWLAPLLAKQQVANIRDGLIAADPSNKAVYEANATAYIKQLEELNQQFKQTLEPYKGCTYVTFHDAYRYLANAYQLKQVAVVEIPEDSLSPADVQKAVTAVKQYKVKALLGEPGTDNKLLESLSKDLNLTLRPIDPLENGPLDPQHYFTAMKNNLQTLQAACQ